MGKPDVQVSTYTDADHRVWNRFVVDTVTVELCADLDYGYLTLAGNRQRIKRGDLRRVYENLGIVMTQEEQLRTHREN